MWQEKLTDYSELEFHINTKSLWEEQITNKIISDSDELGI